MQEKLVEYGETGLAYSEILEEWVDLEEAVGENELEASREAHQGAAVVEFSVGEG